MRGTGSPFCLGVAEKIRQAATQAVATNLDWYTDNEVVRYLGKGLSQGNMGLAEPTMYTTTSNISMAAAPSGSLSYSGETLGKLMARAKR